MLTSLNVTIIPFLLGAVVFIKDQAEWNLGPKYKFELKKTMQLFLGNKLISEYITATVTCRPKMSSQNIDNILSCNVRKIFPSLAEYPLSQDGTQCDPIYYKLPENTQNQRFVVMFSKQGVQDFKEIGRKLESPIYDIIPDIVEQFNIGVDLSTETGDMKKFIKTPKGEEQLCNFTQTNEDTMRAFKCMTHVAINLTSSNRSHKDGKYQSHTNNTNSGFHLNFLPIPSHTNSANMTFSIQKTRVLCAQKPNNTIIMHKKWSINQTLYYYNKMKICNTSPKFTSHTRLEGYILENNTRYHFSENVYLDLLDIHPV